jgi:Domain of unknown function (DUF4439)
MSASPASPASPAPSGKAAAALARATLVALQGALGAEHAAVFGYAIAGAHLSGARRAAAERDWAAHEVARDDLTAMVSAVGGQPVPAAASYTLPFPVHGTPSAVALMAFMEDGVATAYLGLVGLTDPRLRAFGAKRVQAAALRAAGWRDRSLAFPGLQAPRASVPGRLGQ